MTAWMHPIEFRDPWFLAAGLLAVVVYLFARGWGGRLLFSSVAILPDGSSWRTRLDFLPDALLALATLGLGVALSGPRMPDSESLIRKEGIAIMMVVDTSSSMKALDLSPPGKEETRLDAVKDVFVDFVTGDDDLSGRPDDVVGLVSFAGFAETRCPLTLDHKSLALIASDLEIVKRRADDGTAVGDGLGLAVLRLTESPAKSKVAILLTDGSSNTGIESPLGAAALAAEAGIKVYAIGAGTNGLASVRVADPFTGGTREVKVPVEIDEETLGAIAEKTGGRYFRATDREALRNIYAEISELEHTELEGTRFAKYREYYGLAIAIALALALLAWILRGTQLRRLP